MRPRQELHGGKSVRPGLDVRGLIVMLINSHLACDATKV